MCRAPRSENIITVKAPDNANIPKRNIWWAYKCRGSDEWWCYEPQHSEYIEKTYQDFQTSRTEDPIDTSSSVGPDPDKTIILIQIMGKYYRLDIIKMEQTFIGTPVPVRGGNLFGLTSQPGTAPREIKRLTSASLEKIKGIAGMITTQNLFL